jgi:hypothetical protein
MKMTLLKIAIGFGLAAHVQAADAAAWLDQMI